jgi:hypothetical protein
MSRQITIHQMTLQVEPTNTNLQIRNRSQDPIVTAEGNLIDRTLRSENCTAAQSQSCTTTAIARSTCQGALERGKESDRNLTVQKLRTRARDLGLRIPTRTSTSQPTKYYLRTTIPWFSGRRYEILVGIDAMSGDYRLYQSLQTVRTVSWGSSPGFQAIERAERVVFRAEMNQRPPFLAWHDQAIQQELEVLYNSLQTTFRSRDSMAKDEDENGFTMLRVSSNFEALHCGSMSQRIDQTQHFMRICGKLRVSSKFHNSISRIILLLMEFGDNLNSSCRVKSVTRCPSPTSSNTFQLVICRETLEMVRYSNSIGTSATCTGIQRPRTILIIGWFIKELS